MDDNILEELEERAAIIQYDAGLSKYEASQEACRCAVRRHGEHLRPHLLVWLKEQLK